MLVKISDNSPVATPYVSPAGVQYPPNIEDVWTDAELAAIGLKRADAPTAFNPETVKAECRRRILLVISATAQTNASAAKAANWPMAASDAQRAEWNAAFEAGVQWVWNMRAVCASLVAAQDATFANDAHWPPAPASALALAAMF